MMGVKSFDLPRQHVRATTRGAVAFDFSWLMDGVKSQKKSFLV
jgi:hypothetical protein